MNDLAVFDLFAIGYGVFRADDGQVNENQADNVSKIKYFCIFALKLLHFSAISL